MHNLAAHWTEKGDPVDPSRRGPVANPAAPNLPTQNLPTEIAWLRISGKLPMDMRIPPLQAKTILVKPSEIQNLSTEIGPTKIAWLRISCGTSC